MKIEKGKCYLLKCDLAESSKDVYVLECKEVESLGYRIKIIKQPYTWKDRNLTFDYDNYEKIVFVSKHHMHDEVIVQGDNVVFNEVDENIIEILYK